MITHTVNPRLFQEQIAWIINDAQDTILFLDSTFLSIAEKLVPECKSLRHIVLMTDRSHMPAETTIANLLCYEELIEAEPDHFDWPQFDENTASGLCYTSGTTGNPKGALYSHRSTVLHAYAAALPDSMSFSARDCVMPVVPMFHVNAWGIPYSAALTGAKLVFPGAGLDGKSLYELIEEEKVTFSAGVPTVWLGLLHYVQENDLQFSSFERMIIGGAACPPSMICAFADYGVQVNHAWGMTELSPLGSVCKLGNNQTDLDQTEQQKVLVKQGRAVPGIDWKISDSTGKDLPWDGKAFGDLMVRGSWVIQQYYNRDGSPLVDGWFPTGDVATIDADGYMQITDRSKDVIKSGGEWISSIEVENLAMSHSSVKEAAVIACRHPKWDERPLLVVVVKSGCALTREHLLDFYEGKIAKWWIPDDVVFVEQLPHTATGKLQKLKLREQFHDHKLPTA
jgi:fatty-acyl-CoA synthase